MKRKLQKFRREWRSKGPREKLYMAGGLLMTLLAIVGVFVPIVPQVPFAILAAFLFSRGSQRLHRWIRGNKYFGTPVRDWEDHRVVRPKLKFFSALAMAAGALIGHWKFDRWSVSITLDVIFASCIVFVLTRKSSTPKHRWPSS